MGILLALAAAASYGASDFLGGVLSRTRSAWAVAVGAHLTAALVTLVVAVLVGGHPVAGDFAWGAASGVGEGVGIGFLFRGMGRGQMSVVAPVSGTAATLVPVVVGVATGDQPPALAWVGIALALPAVVLIPRSSTDTGSGTDSTGLFYGAIAGLGFGAQLATVGRIGGGAGLFPLTLFWLASATTVVAIATAARESWRPRLESLRRIAPVGLLSSAAAITYLLATREGLLTIVSVIAALYPAGTVALAAVVLRERIGRVQAAGLGLAVVAVVLVSVG